MGWAAWKNFEIWFQVSDETKKMQQFW
jgi:hypothetical protein